MGLVQSLSYQLGFGGLIDPPEIDLPWVLAVRRVDCREGLSHAEVQKQRKKQSHLPAEILPYLLISSARAARDVEVLRLLRVTHVLNAAGAGARVDTNALRRAGITKTLELDGRDVEG